MCVESGRVRAECGGDVGVSGPRLEVGAPSSVLRTWDFSSCTLIVRKGLEGEVLSGLPCRAQPAWEVLLIPLGLGTHPLCLLFFRVVN